MMSGDMVSRLIALLDMERKAHRETRRKLEKAAHDRERYARRTASCKAAMFFWHKIITLCSSKIRFLGLLLIRLKGCC